MEAKLESAEASAEMPNGIQVEWLGGWIAAMSEDPAAAQLAVRLRHRWDGGFAVDGEIAEVSQMGEVQSRSHTFRTDWPAPFGADSGPTPGAESILAAVGACVATTYAAKAALGGIHLDALEVTTEGKVDLRGLFEVGGEATPRFSEIAVSVAVSSDADEATLEALGERVSHTSPAFDALANPVPITLGIRRHAGEEA